MCLVLRDCLTGMGRAELVHAFTQEFCGVEKCPVHCNVPRPETDFYTRGPGLAVIINQKTFRGLCGLEDRLGTDRDRDKLEVSFTLYGGECKIYDDLDDAEMIEKLDEASEIVCDEHYKWLAVVVLSHGRRTAEGKDEVMAINGVGIDRNEIRDRFLSADLPNLQKKPKLFFFQVAPSTLSSDQSTIHIQVHVPCFQACRGVEEPTAPPTGTREGSVTSDAPVPTLRGTPLYRDYMVNISITIRIFF